MILKYEMLKIIKGIHYIMKKILTFLALNQMFDEMRNILNNSIY